VLQMVQARGDRELEKWIAAEATFPNAMVDRIVPATKETDLEFLKERYGMVDRIGVKCEDYLQWVLEDQFCDERPDLGKVGVTVVHDVVPYEQMKIRLLNSSHTALAYLSTLLDVTTVDEAMRHPLISKFVKNYMDEVTPSVARVPGVDLEQYKDKLRERFSNEAISDSIARVGMDGSKKMRDFLGPSLKERLANGMSTKNAALVVASWIQYMTGVSDTGKTITTINDPMASTVTPLAKRTMQHPQCDPKDFIQFVLGDLSENHHFVERVRSYLLGIKNKGTRATLTEALV